MGKCKKYLELREKYNEAVQNQAGFQYEIDSYRRLLTEVNPSEDGDRYSDLLEALYRAEERYTYWTMRAAEMQYKMYKIEQHYHWNEQ